MVWPQPWPAVRSQANAVLGQPLCSQPRLPTEAEFRMPPGQVFLTAFPARVRGQDGMGSSEPQLLKLVSKNRSFFLCPGPRHGPCRKMYVSKADGASGNGSWPHAPGSGHSQASQGPRFPRAPVPFTG